MAAASLMYHAVQVVAVAQTFCEVWEKVGGILGELDLLAAFADLSVIAPTPYIRPHILPAHSNHLELLGSRCLKLMLCSVSITCRPMPHFL